jgi:hypothetical protein
VHKRAASISATAYGAAADQPEKGDAELSILAHLGEVGYTLGFIDRFLRLGKRLPGRGRATRARIEAGFKPHAAGGLEELQPKLTRRRDPAAPEAPRSRGTAAHPQALSLPTPGGDEKTLEKVVAIRWG